MAEMTIRLQVDPATGKKNIVVSLSSDSDSLPQEHETMHKELVNKLIEGGILKAGEAGDLVVEREEESAAPSTPAPAQAEEERRSETQGN